MITRPADRGARRPGRPRTSLSRQALLTAGRAVFSQHGYAGASMAAVAGRLDIRKASLFHHFPSKEALYFSIMEATMEELEQMFAQLLQPAGVSFATRLDRFSETLNRHLGAHPEVASLLYRDFMFGGPYFEGPGRDRVLSLIAGVVQLFEDGMRRGEAPRQDARHLTLSVLGLYFSYFAAADLRGELLPRGRLDPIEERMRESSLQLRRLCGVRV